LEAALVKHGLLFNFEENNNNNSTCPLYKTTTLRTSHPPAREESNKYDLTGAPYF
jgi:hypothetical protein